MLRPTDISRDEFYEPLADPGKVTGFTSPAQDYIQKRLDITERFMTDPTNTFFFYAEGDQLKAFGIDEGNLLVVDRSLPVLNGSLIICHAEGEWTVKSVNLHQTHTQYQVWGIITWICKPQQQKQIDVRIGRL